MIIALLAVSACVSGPDATGRQPIALKLYRATADRQYTYFVLSRNGELAFGGGSEARTRTAAPAGTLTEAEILSIDATIERYGLMTLENRSFTKAATVAYEASIQRAGSRRTYRAIDDDAADLVHLHDLLFALYSHRAHRLPQF